MIRKIKIQINCENKMCGICEYQCPQPPFRDDHTGSLFCRVYNKQLEYQQGMNFEGDDFIQFDGYRCKQCLKNQVKTRKTKKRKYIMTYQEYKKIYPSKNQKEYIEYIASIK